MEQNNHFATTQWTIIRQAGDDDSGVAQSALQQLCQRYWSPLYSFVRFRGYSASEAEDLTQAFFARLLQRKDMPKAQPELGRFRSFLLTALKNFLANEWDKKQAAKRGGGKAPLSLDFAHADSRFRIESVNAETPEAIFDRQWASTLLDQVHRNLESEFEKKGKRFVFEKLKMFLAGKSRESTMAQAASQLSMTEVAVKVAVHRMRARFGELLRMEIQSTLDSEEDVEDEIRRLFEALQK